jgi:hypothetical protein
MVVRRFAAVVCKPLVLQVRWSGAAVLRWSAMVAKKSMNSMCGGVRRMGWSAPPYPYALRGAILARAAGAWSRKG